MTRTAKMRSEHSLASVRRRLTAALCMVLISMVMLATSTYAWFTLSVAPEVRGVNTSVTGNGSLEIALLPADGDITAITSGRGTSGTYAGGSATVQTANTSWGNLVDISAVDYGLSQIALLPAAGSVSTAGEFSIVAPGFGHDGRLVNADASAVQYKSYNKDEGKFSGTGLGARVINPSDTKNSQINKFGAYGYVIDLAVRSNVTCDLTLQQDEAQRIYSGATSANTQGGGSVIDSASATAFKVAFVKDFAGGTPEFLAYAKPGTDGKLSLTDKTGASVDKIMELEEGTPYQISVLIWFEGGDVTNADLASTGGQVEATVNLQFASDSGTVLNPAVYPELRDNPPAAETTEP